MNGYLAALNPAAVGMTESFLALAWLRSLHSSSANGVEATARSVGARFESQRNRFKDARHSRYELQVVLRDHKNAIEHPM